MVDNPASEVVAKYTSRLITGLPLLSSFSCLFCMSVVLLFFSLSPNRAGKILVFNWATPTTASTTPFST